VLSEQDLINWQEAKRKDWAKQKEGVLNGKLQPQDLIIAAQAKGHQRGDVKNINFAKIETALEEQDDSAWADD
jgi:hypothetical protein